MKNLYVHTHLGNGDHIICNGMIRHLESRNGISSVTTFCYEHNEQNVRFMFRDNENIIVEPFNIEDEKKHYNLWSSKKEDNVLIICYGYTEKYRNKNTLSFDETFYEQARIDFNVRFEKFYVKRDHKNEEKALAQLTSDKDEYIYVHDAPSRGCYIDRRKINSKLPVVVNCFDYNIFQMRKVLENATEIHTMQTGMFDFCNSIDLKCPIYVHRYVRGYTNFLLSKMNKNNNYIFID